MPITLSGGATRIWIAIAAVSFALQSLGAMPADERNEDDDFGSQTEILYKILKSANRLSDVITDFQDNEVGTSLSRMAIKEANETLEQLVIEAIPESGGPPFYREVYDAFQKTPEFQVVKEVGHILGDNADVHSILKATEFDLAQDGDAIGPQLQQTIKRNKIADPAPRFQELAKAMLSLRLDQTALPNDVETDWILSEVAKGCNTPQTILELENLKRKVNSSDSFKTFACSVRAFQQRLPSREAWSAALTLNEVIGLELDDFLVNEIPEFNGNHAGTLARLLAVHEEQRIMLSKEVSIGKVGEIQSLNPSKLFQGTEADYARRAEILFSMAKLKYQALLLVESQQQKFMSSNCRR